MFLLTVIHIIVLNVLLVLVSKVIYFYTFKRHWQIVIYCRYEYLHVHKIWGKLNVMYILNKWKGWVLIRLCLCSFVKCCWLPWTQMSFVSSGCHFIVTHWQTLIYFRYEYTIHITLEENSDWMVQVKGLVLSVASTWLSIVKRFLLGS